jgi:hypothetical protein
VSFFAFGLVFGFEVGDGFVDFGLLGFVGVAVGLGDEAGVEVDVDDAAFGVGTAGVGYGAEHVVGHVARGVAEGAGVGVRGDDGGAGDDEGAVEGAVGDVGDVDHHAEAVHLVDDVFAELGEALFGVGDGLVVDVAGAVGPAGWSWTR